MSMLRVLSGLIVSAGLAWGIPASVLAQSQSSSDVLNNLNNQPNAPEDLVINSLTDDQAAQIVSIFETYQPQIDAATAGYLQTLAVLNDLLVPATSERALTDARNDAVGARQTIDDLVFERNLALREVLAVDQRQAINDYLRDWLGLGPADTAAAFPRNLIGNALSSTLATLQADGWQVVVQTPGSVDLNRNTQQLNLAVNGGQIVDAQLTN